MFKAKETLYLNQCTQGAVHITFHICVMQYNISVRVSLRNCNSILKTNMLPCLQIIMISCNCLMAKQCWIKMSQQCDSSLQTLSQVLTVVAQ